MMKVFWNQFIGTAVLGFSIFYFTRTLRDFRDGVAKLKSNVGIAFLVFRRVNSPVRFWILFFVRILIVLFFGAGGGLMVLRP